jgi:hypothetical protein
MSEDKKPPTTPPAEPPKRRSSGNHPAVRDYRRKLESISDADGLTAGALGSLDAELSSYLDEVRSSAPPPMSEEEPPPSSQESPA